MRPLARGRGSAYVVTLLALVVLSAIGLGVALITQTEMQIGANERTIQRVFYAADTGLAASTARALVKEEYFSKTITIDDPDSPVAMNFRHEIESSPFYPISWGWCNLCSINNADTIEPDAYFRINYAVTVNARRVGGAGIRVAEKTLATMIEVQPRQFSPEAQVPLDEPGELEKIKF